jgi:hypothetical protein
VGRSSNPKRQPLGQDSSRVIGTLSKAPFSRPKRQQLGPASSRDLGPRRSRLITQAGS